MGSTFSERLAHYMTKRNLAQLTLARASGLSRQSISAWLNGSRKPSADKLARLADALQVEISELNPKAEAPTGLNFSLGADAMFHCQVNTKGTIALVNSFRAIFAKCETQELSITPLPFDTGLNLADDELGEPTITYQVDGTAIVDERQMEDLSKAWFFFNEQLQEASDNQREELNKWRAMFLTSKRPQPTEGSTDK